MRLLWSTLLEVFLTLKLALLRTSVSWPLLLVILLFWVNMLLVALLPAWLVVFMCWGPVFPGLCFVKAAKFFADISEPCLPSRDYLDTVLLTSTASLNLLDFIGIPAVLYCFWIYRWRWALLAEALETCDSLSCWDFYLYPMPCDPPYLEVLQALYRRVL